jgi:hypothetical protein
VAFRIRQLLQGRDISEVASADWVDDPALPPSTEYRLPKIEEWRAIRDTVCKRLIEAGRPSTPRTDVEAAKLTATHLRRLVRQYAGSAIPEGQRIQWLEDRFDPDRFRDVKEDLISRAQGSASPTRDEVIEWLAGIRADDFSLVEASSVMAIITATFETLSVLTSAGSPRQSAAGTPRLRRRGTTRSPK